ncbi:MAG: methyltransferase domain-containing protein [Bacteriovorax sp.]|nr:methyltransferase domain-containing protein [Bacteriovorax sp.]
MKTSRKLNLGAGTIILNDFVNLDCAQIPGIDVVHDLNSYPWPFEDNTFDYVLAEDLIEHLNNPMTAIEEIHRITSSGGIAEIQVPYWNSWSANTDLSHRHRFTEHSFDYFDPGRKLGQLRYYYSNAKFNITEEEIAITPILPWLPLPRFSYFKIKNKFILKFFYFLAGFFCNVIQDFRVKMKVIKEA